ncbi:YhcG family protein [Chlorobium sp. KB01]|uniref:PDDEXK nuclease domain-containing protein n=1 Tax=Chlorobium sp. KB01 TaxID=1917528 RepID=UPI000977A2A8|nr:PDDEXK nuclease domain-containing protein [Chlorobium sp. KB01]
MNYKQLLTLFEETNRALQQRAVRSVDTSLVIRNWLFGWYIVEFEQGGSDRAEYGANLLKKIAAQLKLKGCSERSLALCCKFYLTYSGILQALPAKSSDNRIGLQEIQQTLPVPSCNAIINSPQILQALSAKLAGSISLGWTHYVALLTISNVDERRFYEIEASENSWGARELERQIAASLYERLALSRDKDGVRLLAEKGLLIEKPADVIKNPLVLEFLDLEEKSAYSEHALETAIIDHLEHFLLELGKGFLFEARQKRFTFDNDHFYVDLVFYNRLLRCYVLIDLKRDKLTHQDLGQMQMYVNYFDRYVKTDDELPTIGILLCHRKHDALVELTLPKDSNIFASKYQLYLPSKEELKRQLEEAAGIEHREHSDQEGTDDVR